MRRLAALAAAVCTAAAARSAAPRPNVLLIMWDDAGIGDVSAYSNEMSRPRLQTPAAQQLADEGLTFYGAYTGAPVCAPSRNALWTGLHNGHIAGTPLTNKTVSMAHVLSASGYHVGMVGKWGLADDNPKPKAYHHGYRPPAPSAGHPTNQGFGTVSKCVDNQWTCHDYYGYFAWDGDTLVNITKNANASEANCGPDHDDCYWAGDIFADAAEDFLGARGRERREAERLGAAPPAPWMLYVSFTSPHAGSVGSVEENDVPAPRASQWPYKAEGAAKGWPDVEVDFGTAVSETDNRTRSVLAELSRQGLAEDTLVLLLSDNGAHDEGGHSYEFFNSSAWLNGFKRSMHDGGIRTPAIARWPGHTAPGSVTSQQFAFYDVLPTLAELAGAAVPKRVDGHSFAPVLLDSAAEPEAPPFLYHQFGNPQDPGFCSGEGRKYPNGCAWGQAVHVGNMSAVCLYPKSHESPAEPLRGLSAAEVALFGNAGREGVPAPPCDDVLVYNLTADPGQRTNIASSQPAFVQHAKELFVSQHDPPASA